MEQLYRFNTSKDKLIEKVVDADHIGINHIILNKGDALPEHNSNSNVYMVVVRGTLTLQLAEQAATVNEAGSIVNIPYGIKMNVSNKDDEQLEFFVVKAPNPRNYIK